MVGGLKAESSIKSVKPITAVLDEMPLLDEEALQLAQAVSVRYGCSWGEAVDLMLPRNLRLPRSSKIQSIADSILRKKGERLMIRSSSTEAHWPEINKRFKDAAISVHHPIPALAVYW